MRLHLAVTTSIALLMLAAPASATIITVTLSGTSENVHDNANVFGQGIGTLTDLPFVETLTINTAVGVDASGGYSSNSIFDPNPPFAVSGTLSFNGGTPFAVMGSNYAGAHITTTTSSNPFFSSTMTDLTLLTDDSVGNRLDNQFYVDLTGASLPASFLQPATVTLDPSQVSNVSFTDETSGKVLPDAIGNLTPTTLAISVPGASSAVPEPATWLSALFGFGAIGGLLRRRRSSAWLA